MLTNKKYDDDPQEGIEPKYKLIIDSPKDNIKSTENNNNNFILNQPQVISKLSVIPEAELTHEYSVVSNDESPKKKPFFNNSSKSKNSLDDIPKLEDKSNEIQGDFILKKRSKFILKKLSQKLDNQSEDNDKLQDSIQVLSGITPGNSSKNVLGLIAVDEEKSEEIETKNTIIEQGFIDYTIFWTIFKTMALSEFGDRTQISGMILSSVFNLTGVLIGSCLALFTSCILGVYYGKNLIKYLNERKLNFVLGLIFLGYGIQIFIGKKKSNV